MHQTELFRTGRLEPIEINSALVSAQNRRRLYWTNIPGITQPKDRGILLKDIIENDVNDKYYITERRKKYQESTDRTRVYKITDLKTGCILKRQNGGSDQLFFIDEKGWRQFTPIELERLQNVDDNYTNYTSDSQRFSMLGNGWTVDVIAHIFKNINELS